MVSRSDALVVEALMVYDVIVVVAVALIVASGFVMLWNGDY